MSFKAIVALAAIVLGSTVGYCAFIMRPEIFRQCTSPDGTWTTYVERSWRFISVPVTVRSSIRGRSKSYERVIDSSDMWADVEDQYWDMQCDDHNVRIGSKYWDGEKFTYLVLRKQDVEAL